MRKRRNCGRGEVISGKWQVTSGKWRAWRLAAALLLLATVAATPDSGQRKFYDDDPIAREPETQDASRAAPKDINLIYDLALNLFAQPGDPGTVRAQNINTIDEVPDSNWFTNRDLKRGVSIDELAKGPNTSSGPAAGKIDGHSGQKIGCDAGIHGPRFGGRHLVCAIRCAGT